MDLKKKKKKHRVISWITNNINNNNKNKIKIKIQQVLKLKGLELSKFQSGKKKINSTAILLLNILN